MAATFSTYGLKPTGEEVVEAKEAERDAVETLFFLSLVHGGTVSDDIFLVPDHGKVILYADHHEAVHASFCDQKSMDQFLTDMAKSE
jgi:hypothetical protein